MRAQVLLLLAASAHATTLLSLRGGAKEKVAIIGSGNWGSAIAKVVGRNVIESDEFDAEVRMWVFEEEVKDRTGTPRKLTEIINQHHENVKYLPGIKLPDNVIADPDLRSAVQDASLLVFVLPHQFLGRICPEMTSHRRGARAISLIKGIEFDDKGPVLISSMIKEAMGGMDVSVLMGANVASEVAKDEFCESTVGYSNKKNGAVWQRLFDAPRFKVGKIEDVAGVELCGALKNVVALGAGFCDGLGYGGNTKAAIIRIGLEETSRFSKMFFKNVKEATFMESCGLADLVTTCFGGRNRKCAAAFARKEGSWEQLEKRMLNGQKLQGTITAVDVMKVLEAKKLTAQFPLFSVIHDIAFRGAELSRITDLSPPAARGPGWRGLRRGSTSPQPSQLGGEPMQEAKLKAKRSPQPSLAWLAPPRKRRALASLA